MTPVTLAILRKALETAKIRVSDAKNREAVEFARYSGEKKIREQREKELEDLQRDYDKATEF